MGHADMTVILPCAGEGTRLDAGGPKELFQVFPGVSLIDFSLNHIRVGVEQSKTDAGGGEIRVAAVIRPWKTKVGDYVRRKLPGVEVDTLMFDENYVEWPGSIYSARRFFSPHNLVLFPDSYLALSQEDPYRDGEGRTLAELVGGSLLSFSVTFGVIACSDPDILGRLGAVRVEGGRVQEFQDKPVESPDRFNGFWACCAFKRDVGRVLYDFLLASVMHRADPIRHQPFYPPGIIPAAAYYDLGTRESIREFRQHRSRSTIGPNI